MGANEGGVHLLIGLTPASAGAVAANPGEKPAAEAQATGTAPTANPPIAPMLRWLVRS